MSFIDTDDPFSVAAKRIRSSVIRPNSAPQLPIQGRQQPTTYIIEPDLMEIQTGNQHLPNDVAFDDAGFAYNTITGNPVQIVRRPNVLPVAKTPDGLVPVMPKMLDIMGNVMSPLAAGRVPVKAGEVVLGSGAVRTMPEAVKEITPFYSALERTVDNAKISKASPEQWLGYLRNQPGVRQEELEYVLGNLPKGPISKEALAGLIKQNKVKLGEVVKGEKAWDSLTQLEIKEQEKQFKEVFGYKGSLDEIKDFYNGSELSSPTKYHDYQLPGGENYQEMLLTLPDKQKRLYEWEYFDPKTQTSKQFKTEAEAKANAPEGAIVVPKETQTLNEHFKSSHWDEPNIIAHVRYNDRMVDGKKTLHLEEIQSDWHQAGRKQGYKNQSDVSKETEALTNARIERERAFRDFQSAVKADKPEEEIQRLQTIFDTKKAETDAIQKRIDAINSGVPDAPFKKNWDELAFKRMLHKAANEGYDSVSWTPGEAQAARYDLSKQISKITYNAPGSKAADKYGTVLKAYDHNGHEVINKAAKPEELTDLIGKEAAEKLLKTEAKNDKHELAGLDLKVGGEGMKSFYDKMLVDKANALAKKYGAKVETRNLQVAKQNSLLQKLKENGYDENADIQQILADNGGRKPSWLTNEELDLIEQGKHLEFKGINQQPVHVLELTPELRAKAKEGFPLFSSTPITTPVDYDPFNNNKKYKLTPVTYDPFK